MVLQGKQALQDKTAWMVLQGNRRFRTDGMDGATERQALQDKTAWMVLQAAASGQDGMDGAGANRRFRTEAWMVLGGQTGFRTRRHG
jgi:hypothetical protein